MIGCDEQPGHPADRTVARVAPRHSCTRTPLHRAPGHLDALPVQVSPHLPHSV
jgi:hypothetical protein